ncbi:MAG TPA: hypothetical protein VN612_15510 [Acidobacteriaceae bacterium]|nr:hypothetical protein [Acidobacteriaceae bacterium]
MPEELGIALLVLVVLGWGLFKLLAYLLSLFNAGTAEFSNWHSRKAKERLARKRKAFERHVRVLVPDELGRARRDLDRLHSQFTEAQQNQPITLLNGSQLLGLLKKHGYSFQIDLEQARRLRLNL